MRIEFPVEVRAVMTKADGSTVVIECVSIEVAGSITRRAPSAEKLKPHDAKATRYPVPVVPNADLRAMLDGALDGVDDCATQAHRTRIMHIVCDMRRRAFKLGAMTFTVRDVQLLGSAISAGMKPSTMAKAIGAACREPFWRDTKKDIPLASLVDQAEALAAKYTATPPRQRATDAVARLAELDPVGAVEKSEMLATLKTDEQIADFTREVLARVNKTKAAQ